MINYVLLKFNKLGSNNDSALGNDSLNSPSSSPRSPPASWIDADTWHLITKHLPRKHESQAVVDLNDIVRRWFPHTWTAKHGAKSLRNITSSFNTSLVMFEQDEANFDTKEATTKDVVSQQTLFRTYLTNNSDHEQVHTFETERVTRQTVNVKAARGFTATDKLDLSLKIPGDIVELGVGFKREEKLNVARETTLNVDVKWSVSNISHLNYC